MSDLCRYDAGPRYFKAGARLVLAALLVSSAIVASTLVPAQASPARNDQPARDAGGAAWTSAAEPPAATAAKAVTPSGSCDRSRRRLWIEGEGWIVRRVPVCR